MQLHNLNLYILNIPGKAPVYPYRASLGETLGARPLIVEIAISDGIIGWGETARSSTAPSFWPKSRTELQALQEQITGLIEQTDLHDIEPITNRLWAAGLPHTLVAGVEMALWDLKGKAASLPLCHLLGGVHRRTIPLCACLGILPAEDSARVAEKYVEQGFTTMKLKAGRNAEQDLASVKAIRQAVGSAIELRIDANQAYSPLEALRLCRKLEEWDLQYFEQPCRQDMLSELARKRLATRVPIALNESCRTPLDMLRIARMDVADCVLPDTHLSGGIAQVKRIAAIAEAAGIPMAMHCGHDLGVKTAAVLHLVASSPGFRFASDTTVHSLPSDLLSEPLRIVGGSIELPAGPGLGVEVDRAQLERYQA
jgi:L-alanine-DL-glutamate epimerase-like enolase superfamily enzyme